MCEGYASCDDVAPRPPALCQGCGHRDVYTALNEVLKDYPNARVFGDIGCYTLGFMPPFKAIHSCVDMGASITMAKGASDAGQWPAVAIIGDSTFTHSGMTGLLDAINENANITVIISDNLTTGMTGGQDSAGTGKFEDICRGLGLSDEHLKVVVPLPKNSACKHYNVISNKRKHRRQSNENRYHPLRRGRTRYPLDRNSHWRSSHAREPLYQAGRGPRYVTAWR